MPQLTSPRWEAFAQAYARGENAGRRAASYYAAGYKCNHECARVSAGRLLKQQRVTRRIAEIQQEHQAMEAEAMQQAVARLAITKEQVIGQLARIAFANIFDYVKPMSDGTVKVDLSRIDHDKGAAIREIIVDERRDDKGQPVQRIRVKLADARAALVDLGRHFGLFVERHQVTHDYADMNEQQLAEYIRNVATELARNGIDVPSLVGIRKEPDGNSPDERTYDAVALPAVPEAAAIPRGGTDVS